jgi:hypothetical protein
MTTLSDVPLTVGAADHVLLRATVGRFQTIVRIFEIAAQRSSPICDAVMAQLLVSPDKPFADVTKYAPAEFCEIEQTAGVEVVKVTGNLEVACAVKGTVAPNVALVGGVNEIDCGAYAPG